MLRRHLSVANVLSCIALFVALAGSAYAAVKIGPNAVKTKNIANQAVTNAKIKTQAVTSGKIKNGGVVNADLGAGAVTNSKIASKAVTSAKLGTEAVVASNLAKKAVTESKLGPESVGNGKVDNEAITSAKISSATWKQLLKNVTYVTEASINDSETSKTVTAACPTGKEAIGGGVRINSPATVNVVPLESAPVVSATNARVGWIAGGREYAAEAGNWQVVAYAVCAEL